MKFNVFGRHFTVTAGAAMTAGLAVLGVLAAPASALAPAASPATASEQLLGSSNAVKVVGVKAAAQGLRLVFEHRNQDGSVTSRWTANNGTGFTYAGTPGVTVDLRNGNTAHGGYGAMTVTFPKTDKKAGSGADLISAYRAAGRSTYTDALNAGISKAAANAQLGKYRTVKGVVPYDISGSFYQSGCIQPSGPRDVIGVWGCFTRRLIQTNGSDWYVGDDLVATENPGLLQPNTLYILMWYGSGNTVVNWTAAPGSTGCHDATLSGSLGVGSIGLGYSETNKVCSGSTSVIHDSAHWGLDWIDNSAYWVTPPQEQIEEIGVVHSPPSASIGNSALELAWGPGARDSGSCRTPSC
ncbi:hypothetical protein [Streptacidiphilus sp. EB129]|uniref:hypothetical protein n=1 Tax=Streptacidiphilus sp. EB129 TaxID=3156262 RepID=UPI003514A8D8